MCTTEGHVVGMLDRDQRTVKMCVLNRHVVLVQREHSPEEDGVLTKRNKTISHSWFVPGRTSPHSSCKSRKNPYFWKSLHRLKHALIVGAYLSLVTFPSISSAPAMSSTKTEPKWLNPNCAPNKSGGGGSGSGAVSNAGLIDAIIIQAGFAKSKADIFIEAYVQETFKKTVKEQDMNYPTADYPLFVLNKTLLNKSLGEPVPSSHLQTLEFKETLVKVYAYLQQLAAGIEQSIVDDKKDEGKFVSRFNDTLNWLCLVLCELQTAIAENNLEVPEYQHIDFDQSNQTQINLRNWIYYRNYLNLLEYIVDVFKHFQANLPN